MLIQIETIEPRKAIRKYSAIEVTIESILSGTYRPDNVPCNDEENKIFDSMTLPKGTTSSPSNEVKSEEPK